MTYKLSSMRRLTNAAKVGNIVIGGGAPVRLQSMTTTPTLDTEASVNQVCTIAEAGAELVRLTAQGVEHSKNLAQIHSSVRARGVEVPLVADIHFNPAAAFEAALHVEKVRINPGNFFDPGRTFRKMEFTDEEYAAELEKIRKKFIPFIDLCKEHGTAIRIGVNHGSLSDRIMSRYGDGADGMVESALEYLRICREQGFDNVVISIKASDVPLMTDTVRLLVERMAAEDMHYPLHLGVTEAGNAAEGGIGGLNPTSIIDHDKLEDYPGIYVLRACSGDRIGKIRKEVTTIGESPAIIVLEYPEIDLEEDLAIAAAIDFGTLLLDGYQDAICSKAAEICRNIVQAAGIARYKAEIVACPGCGRTLYQLPEVLETVKAACSHLSHLKIAVMGCIVNGPGEMAGADYGYVGAAASKVSLYRGIECVEKNIPAEGAVDKLVELIKSDGKWVEP